MTRVMNDAFSSLPADQLLNNLVRLEITIVLLVETQTYPGQPVRVTLRLPLDSNHCQPDFQKTIIFTFLPVVPLRLSNRGSLSPAYRVITREGLSTTTETLRDLPTKMSLARSIWV